MTRRKRGSTRRQFLGQTSLATCGAFAASQLDFAKGVLARASASSTTEPYGLGKPENTLYTACLNCNTGCGIKVKLLDGVAVKIDGNPYNPFTMNPHLPMATDLGTAAATDTGICPKGQAHHQGAYDPYRIRRVLKRAGKRGEGKWVSIPFDQAVDEIVNGGVLFPSVPGEEQRAVTGLKDVYALRDPAVFSAMGADVAAIRKKTMTVADFKVKWAAYLDALVDPDHPDFGPKNNQFVYMWGRKKGGRSDFAARFTGQFGTANTHGHTTVCQGSLYFACKAVSEQYNGSAFADGQKFYWQADLENSEYVLFVGSNLFDANYGPSNRTPRITQRLADGTLDINVLDPRFTKLASRAPASWIPVKPGTDGAFAMGVTRWMLENGRYDARYLANANKAAAAVDGESTWSNATWLVKIGADGKPGAFVRGSEIGLAPKAPGYEYLVVLDGAGNPVPVDPNDAVNAVEGQLLVDGTLNGTNGAQVRVKSSLQIMLEVAREKTIAEYAAICGVDPGYIELAAYKLTSHGKKAAVDVHRGPAQHTNGFYAISALMNLNVLLGNFDRTGGMIAASTYDYTGSKNANQPFPIGKLTPPARKAFGLSIIRHDAKYEESTIFQGYPAKRNWWPLASDVYDEILPSALDAYPYPVKVVFSYMAAPTYSLPGGHTNIEALTNLDRVPLYFASDITIGPTTAYADYVFPDLHSLERWEMQGSHPNMPVKVQPVRQPVIGSPNEEVVVFGQLQPISYETLWLALAERLGLPGFGPSGFAPGQDLCRPDDFYVRLVANLAWDGSTPVLDATDDEVSVFLAARSHLPATVFDAARWQAIAGASWRKVVTILNRGGRFDTQENSYKGAVVANKYGKLVNLYQEKTAKTKDSFYGTPFLGMARYTPVADVLDREPVAESAGYDLHLVTCKDVRMTKSRTITHGYLNHDMKENTILMSAADATRLAIANGARAKVISASNPDGVWPLGNGIVKPIVGRVQVTQGMRPGVVSFTVGHGMWANGASNLVVDGRSIAADPWRQGGLNANAVMWIDPHLKNTCMIDKVGGSVSFYDTQVRVVPLITTTTTTSYHD